MSLIPNNLIQWGDFGRKCFNVNHNWLETWDCHAARLLYTLPVINNLFLRFKETQIYAFNKAGLPWSLNQENYHSTNPAESLQTRLISSLERSEPHAFLLSASISAASFGLLSPPLAFGFTGVMVLLLIDAVRRKADLLETSRLQPAVPTSADQFILMDERSLRVDFQTITRHGKPDIEGQRMVLQRVLQLFASKDPKPEVITLTHCAGLRSEDLSSFFHPNLKILDLTDSGIESIPPGIEQCKLKEFYLNGCYNLKKMEKLGWLSGSPYQFSHLEKLHISGCDRLTSLQIEAPNLKELKANNNKSLSKAIVRASFEATINVDQTPLNLQTIIEESFPEFAQQLSPDFCRLIRFHVNTEANQDSNLERTIGNGVMKLFQRKIGATYFELEKHTTPPELLSSEGVTLNQHDLIAIVPIINYSRVISLKISDTHMGIRNMELLSRSLQSTSISKLDIALISINENEINVLATALPQTQISSLSLLWNYIEGEGAKHLVTILPKTKINTLTLRKSSVKESEIHSLTTLRSTRELTLMLI